MNKTWGRHGRNNIEEATLRFLSNTQKNKDGCWIWTGKLGSHKRYGTVGIAGRVLLTHRASWMLFKGTDPGEMHVLHRCDNGLCVNPDHLFLGTQRDNVLDMENKNRSNHPRLESHGRAKLSISKIGEAKARIASGEYLKDVAADFGVHRRTLSLAVRGLSWTTK